MHVVITYIYTTESKASINLVFTGLASGRDRHRSFADTWSHLSTEPDQSLEGF